MKNANLLKILTDENATSTLFGDLSTSTDIPDSMQLNLHDYFQLTEIAEQLKPIIESYILNYYFKYLKSELRFKDDPFDAIYLSKLIPDTINKIDLGNLKKYSKVVDLSDNLSFNDGLDD